MQLSDIIQASDDVVAREVSGEIVMLDLETGIYFGLNAVGGRIWKMIEAQGQSISMLCDVIEAEFDAPRSDIERDIMALLSELTERKLITVNAE